jgi:hypothetical protein
MNTRHCIGICGILALAACNDGGSGSVHSSDAGRTPGSGGSTGGRTGGGSGATGGSAGTAVTGAGGGAVSTGGASTGGDGGAGGAARAGGAGGGAVAGGAGGNGGALTTGARGGAGGSGSGGAGGGGLRDAGRDAVNPDAGRDSSTALGPVTFSKNIRLNDDTGSGNQAEVGMAVGPDGLVLVGWMDSRAQRVCAFTVSGDGGETWSKNVSIGITKGTVTNPSSNFVGDPAVAIDANGTLYAVCMDYGMNQIKMMISTDRGASWSTPSSQQEAPDKPWVAGGVSDGALFMSWLGTSAGIKRSLDQGKTWGPIQSVGNIIHGTAITTSTTGLVHVPYNLDSDRNQLRYLRSKDNGETYDKPRDLLANMGTFCFSCNPRQHPIVGAAADPTGRIVAITWTSTLSGGEGDDDVWLMYSKDAGDTWTKPLRVNDNTTKSRQFQSWVAVDDYGRVHVAWTDLRDGGQNETFYARSADPSVGFEANVQVTDGRGSANTDFLGDYKGIAVQNGDVLVVWQDTRRDSGDIYFAKAVGAAGP